jgi:GT2 family glycosyltransferase
MGMTSAQGITAVVCTRNRPHQLARALASLRAQSPPVAEILVIDNAPGDDSTATLVAERFPGVRYLREPVPGLDFARNRALHAATQPIVAFLDDDALAASDWARTLSQVFEADANVAVSTGRVEPLVIETPGQLLFEANGGFGRGGMRIRLPDDAWRPLHGWRAPLIAWAISVGCGCSYAVRRTVALELGGFDEALDLGSPLAGGGDHDLLWRALEAGWGVVYQPQALAWHEHRRDLAAVHGQIIGHQRAVLAFLGKHLARSSVRRGFPLLAYVGWRLLKPGVRLVRRGLGRDPLPSSVLLRMWWNCWIGLSAYPVARVVARTRRERYAV